MTIQNTIILGRNKNGIKVLPWNNNNGMIIAGVSGSGKSQTASLYLTQYAHNGARIILGDYGATMYTGESLTERVAHLNKAMLLPPVNTARDIINYIDRIKDIGRQRQEGKAEMFPLIFAIDEFSAFVMAANPPKRTRTIKEGEYKEVQTEQTYLEKLIESIITLRKFNIKFMLIGQEWAQLKSSGIRSIRSNITTQIIHRLDNSLAGLFGFTGVEDKRQIMNLGVGQIYFNGDRYQVPLLDDKFIAQTVKRLDTQVIITAPDYTQETKRLLPIKRCDGRWNNTRCLAHWLDIDYTTLRNKKAYG